MDFRKIKLSRKTFIPLTHRLASRSFSQRASWIKRFFLALMLVIIVRVLYLQVVARDSLEELAERQYSRQRLSLNVQRGPILDSENNMLAVSLPLKSIFAIPSEIEDAELAAGKLKNILRLEKKAVYSRLNSKSSFVWLSRAVKPEVSEAVGNLKLPGIYFFEEFKRFYPLENYASQVIGFAGIDSQGLEGLEYKFNSYLMNKNELTSLPYFKKNNDFSGASLTLSINGKLQHFAEKELRKAVRAMEAKYAQAIIMDSRSGYILAMANIPDYDPNNFSDYNESTYFNRAISATYEPGSTFKIITVASALDNDVIAKGDFFYCENGRYKIKDRIIHDVERHSWLNIRGVIKKSSNICAAKIGLKMGASLFHEMIRKFGFGSKTGIALSGEARGKVHNFQQWSDIDIATISFGHSISVTPLQIVSAVNAIATGGVLVKPRIVKRIEKANGKTIPLKREPGKRILKEKTAKLVREYMSSVTRIGGTGYSANIEGITVAGKTGTARKFDIQSNSYSSKNHVVSFVGFFPAEKPLLTVMVVIDEPQKKYLNYKSAGPIFKAIAKHAVKYYLSRRPASMPEAIDDAVRSKLFSPARTSGREEDDDNRSERYFIDLFTGKTLREAMRIAGRENIDVRIKGSGSVRKVERLGNSEYRLELN